ncbi:hypothetical protein B0813_003265, partial [Candidatus Fervidibacteria bacterium JGI MDM2 SSWTFF-3-K9]
MPPSSVSELCAKMSSPRTEQLEMGQGTRDRERNGAVRGMRKNERARLLPRQTHRQIVR